MLSKEEFTEKGILEIGIDLYSITFSSSSIDPLTGQVTPSSFTLVIEVDNTEENELGTFVVSKVNNQIIRTGYYYSVEDFLGDIKLM